MVTIENTAIILCILLPILATLATAGRFAVRSMRKMPYQIDDWVILFALITTITSCILEVYGLEEVALGIAGDAKLRDHATLIKATKLFYSIFLLSFFTQGCTKIAILLFYKKMFVVPRFQMAVNVMMVATFCWTLSALIIWGMNHPNIPISSPDFYHMGFYPSLKWLEVMACLDLVFDVVILSLPLPVLAGLQMDLKKKLSVMGLFCLGFIAVLASCMRIWITWRDIRVTPETPLSTQTYINITNNLWLVVEACISIIAACLPVLRGLFGKQVFSSRFSKYIWGPLTSRWNSSSKTAVPTHTSANGATYHKGSKSGSKSRDQHTANGDRDRDWVPLKDVANGPYGLTPTYSHEPINRETKQAYMEDDSS